MNMPPSKEPYDGYCGTSYAAKMLGISVGTVQGLVEKNDLKAWKTQGGHRRISLQSIQDYQRRHNLAPASMMQGEDRLRVLVVEDDENTRLMLQANFDQWGLPLDAVMYAICDGSVARHAKPAATGVADRLENAQCGWF